MHLRYQRLLISNFSSRDSVTPLLMLRFIAEAITQSRPTAACLCYDASMLGENFCEANDGVLHVVRSQMVQCPCRYIIYVLQRFHDLNALSNNCSSSVCCSI